VNYSKIKIIEKLNPEAIPIREILKCLLENQNY
jgi:hypothetical protein